MDDVWSAGGGEIPGGDPHRSRTRNSVRQATRDLSGTAAEAWYQARRADVELSSPSFRGQTSGIGRTKHQVTPRRVCTPGIRVNDPGDRRGERCRRRRAGDWPFAALAHLRTSGLKHFYHTTSPCRRRGGVNFKAGHFLPHVLGHGDQVTMLPKIVGAGAQRTVMSHTADTSSTPTRTTASDVHRGGRAGSSGLPAH